MRRLIPSGIALALVAVVAPAAAADPDPTTVTRLIDGAVTKRLGAEKLTASPAASDAEFLRRVSLDIAGTIPSPDRVAAFLASPDPDKRRKLIDELLDSPGYARRMTDIWSGLLIPNTAAAARQKHDPMATWLQTRFAANVRLDALARGVLTAGGLQDENGAVTFYLTHESVDEITDRVSRVFLGVQIQCAQCHKHPFGDWTQAEYWGMAAFFTKVKSVYVREGAVQKYGAREEVTATKAKALLMVPPSAKAAAPTFLRGAKAAVPADGPYLPALADWVASPDNPYFARAGVNRVWYQFFGRGLVTPVDDMTDDNAPSHPELLAALAKEFAGSGFDLKHLVRGICNSATYQRTSKPAAGNAADMTLYSHAAVRVMTPFQLNDSLESVFALADNEKTPPPTDATRKTKAGERGRFVAFFRGEDDPDPTEFQAGIPQALYLMNSGHHYRIAKAANEVVARLKTSEAVVERLFLATLSRPPTAAEMGAMTSHVARATDKRTAYHDILWALVNSTEFISNH
ncbi:DUF1549 and DUF1553 domain-containing protein [Urbifossiella limnaea]|uniref:DUF1549 domain-containing protein n=1 Tax=Urbifossiella limnaea TaxID=2528023 RepID=A0A517Y1A9_9BACT|nr:DUF1549 and DUF1553 domain-containing protein [Urbifossiella limnaea]QDU23557.1 hypothetical protein ETAA1_55580 [Urbifossiella limnaea]